MLKIIGFSGIAFLIALNAQGKIQSKELTSAEINELRSAIQIIHVSAPEIFTLEYEKIKYIKDRCNEAKKYHPDIKSIRQQGLAQQKIEKSNMSLTYIEDRELSVELSGRFNKRASLLKQRGHKIISDLRNQIPAVEAVELIKEIQLQGTSNLDSRSLVLGANHALDLLEASFSDYSTSDPSKDNRDYAKCALIIEQLSGVQK